ncbi:MAG: hypothetical protein JW902_00665 [Syntrophaceae bacterium]|nr:hypothetical protein [Syntrophaceae bacterium]
MKILTRKKTEKTWKLVESAAYEAEAELQKILAESPELISIQDVRPGAGTLVFAVREFPLPIGSVDLLAFSPQGDIAVIECKLATNPEIKRKVIGQALEYGASMWKMTYNELDEAVKRITKMNLAECVRSAVEEPDWDEEAFRVNVETALEDGSFILMIVVDEINEDLSRIVRFMNACGNPAFSFSALEMRRFQSDQIEMLFPRVIGDNRADIPTSNSNKRKRWTQETFFEDAEQRCNPSTVTLMKKLHEWSLSNGKVRFGTGADSGSYTFFREREGITGSIFSVFSRGDLTINFGYMEKIYSEQEINTFKLSLSEIPTFKGLKSFNGYYFTLEIDDAFSKSEYMNQFKQKVAQL